MTGVRRVRNIIQFVSHSLTNDFQSQKWKMIHMTTHTHTFTLSRIFEQQLPNQDVVENVG